MKKEDLGTAPFFVRKTKWYKHLREQLLGLLQYEESRFDQIIIVKEAQIAVLEDVLGKVRDEIKK